MTFHRYSQRMLNPFRGIVSYISYRSADAVTADGSHWDIYVSNEALLDGLDSVRRPQISDIRYGSWSARRGLKRGPILASDDFLLMEAMGTQVYQHLLEVCDQVPYPLLDHYELWLLDAGGQPLALIDSGDETMSAYERQIRATEQFYDRQMKIAESERVEILSSVVPGSRLHEKIHNPIDEGIDEG